MSSKINIPEIYKSYKPKLFFYVYKMVNNRELAEDLVHNVFLKLNTHLNKINEFDKISAWLFTTARNEVFEHLRKNKNREFVTQENEPHAKSSLVKDIEDAQLIDLIDNEIERMPEEQREVFALREYSELSYKEISLLLNVEIDVVKSRLYMARKKLIKKLSKII